MSKIDLTKFCANDRDERVYLQAPFELDGKVYATNGHWAVCVPAADYPGFRAYVPGTHPKAIVRLFAEASHAAEFAQPLPPIDEPVNCDTCQGSGVWPKHLQESDDDGPEDCWDCGGSGKKRNPIAVGSAHFSQHYLHGLQTMLPNVRLAPRETNAAYVEFDGGHALLMPTRP